MTFSDYIAIAGIILASVFSSLQIFLQLRSNRANIKPKNKRTQTVNIQSSNRSFWLWRRIAIFIVNWLATFVLVNELWNNTEAIVTRRSVLIITFSVAVIAICFILPFIISVYQYIEASFGGQDS
jgi:cobalamin synthase